MVERRSTRTVNWSSFWSFLESDMAVEMDWEIEVGFRFIRRPRSWMEVNQRGHARHARSTLHQPSSRLGVARLTSQRLHVLIVHLQDFTDLDQM